MKRTRYRVECTQPGSKCRGTGYPTDRWFGYRIGAGEGIQDRRKAAASKPCPSCGAPVRVRWASNVLASASKKTVPEEVE